MNKAKGVNGGAGKDITMPEWQQFRLMLLAGALFAENGVAGLFPNIKVGLTSPPNFKQYMPESRFKEMKRWSVFAFASDEEVLRTDDPRCEHRTFGMHHHRRLNQKDRDLVIPGFGGVKILLDERMMPHVPSETKDGGNPHPTYEPRKPDPLGMMTKNSACPDMWVELYHEECDAPQKMREKEFDERYKATAGCTLRLVLGSLPDKQTPCAVYGDSWFSSMCLVGALAKEVPNASYTGVVKTNTVIFYHKDDSRLNLPVK